MRYVSTRGAAPALPFDDVLLAGLAEDGGLYVPEAWPSLSPADFDAMRGLGYAEVAVRVMAPYLGGRIAEEDFAAIIADTYAAFDHPEVAPLVPLGADAYLLELFHGPTLAFKDCALQLLGRLFDHVLARRGERITIIGATSGDTGSAAIEACRGREAVEIFMLHPQGRVSEVQRRQMTTVTADNVHNLAIEGTFDDCQDLVKALFNDRALRAELPLAAVNSINWARIMAQIVYYVWAALRPALSGCAPVFAVPTGNFGNVFAGDCARRMGLPVKHLVVGSNRNDILTRFFETGVMEIHGVHPTLSPSMDIQVSSNFERQLFELYDRDGLAVDGLLRAFRETGELRVDPARWQAVRETFSGYRLDDEGTKRMIKTIHDETGMLVDPHTAVGIHAGRAHGPTADAPLVALATAHPAKFPDAVEAATGVRPALPERLADLFEREESYDMLPNDVAAVRGHIRAKIGLAGAA
ncbi:MAG: threonine synthase [Alphaproteobacteria bacterium]|nr:threonine synthase [Alphaproteobacteria bacterium]